MKKKIVLVAVAFPGLRSRHNIRKNKMYKNMPGAINALYRHLRKVREARALADEAKEIKKEPLETISIKPESSNPIKFNHN
jgi:hypothetical protein